MRVGVCALLAAAAAAGCAGGEHQTSAGPSAGGVGGAPEATASGSVAAAPPASAATPAGSSSGASGAVARNRPTASPSTSSPTGPRTGDSSGALSATSPSEQTFTIVGPDCETDPGHGQAQFYFGQGSSETARLGILSGFDGPGTYRAGAVTAFIVHDQHVWYTDGGVDAVITVADDGIHGTFAYTDSIDSHEHITGAFSCR